MAAGDEVPEEHWALLWRLVLRSQLLERMLRLKGQTALAEEMRASWGEATRHPYVVEDYRRRKVLASLEQIMKARIMERSRAHEYDPSCPDCVPALLDPQTGLPLGKDEGPMPAVLRAWERAPLELKQKYMRFTNGNHAEENQRAMERFLADVQLELFEMKVAAARNGAEKGEQ